MAQFIPKVLILGDLNQLQHDFPTRFKIVGQLEIRDSKFFVDNKEIANVRNLNFDYILCTERKVYEQNVMLFVTSGIPFGQLMMQHQFRQYVSNIGFTAYDLSLKIFNLLSQMKSGSILDLDGYFLRAGMIYRSDFNSNLKIDCVTSNHVEPIFHNLYSEIFSNFDKVKLRHYDLILLTAERSVEDWQNIFNWALKFADDILAFIHCDSPILKFFKSNLRSHFKIEWARTIRGEFMRIKILRGSTAKIFTTTHDKFQLPKLPTGYQLIQGGKKISKIDLGILSDDTGDNVSELNWQINEYTAIYWTWKNAPKTEYIGFAHYRRFFAIPDSPATDRSKDFVSIGKNSEHIMKVEEGIDLLRDCDILVGIPTSNYTAFEYDPREFEESDQNSYFSGSRIYRRWFEKLHPDYLESLNHVESNNLMITNSMFFTRWSLFAEYCDWIFSFLIPAAREHATNDRTMSYQGERAFMCWIMHNRLRVKFLPILLNKNDMHESFGAENFRRLDRILV